MNMPFQTFDEQSDASRCAERVSALRAELARRGLDGFIVPRADEHQGEYVPKSAERLAWLTGFTGSAGAGHLVRGKGPGFSRWRLNPLGREHNATTPFRPPRLFE